MAENQYMVSIVVPIYGVERYIERCAVSLFEQTYGNIEYVFVNDCTKDKSIEILKKVISKYPERNSKIINHPQNSGLGKARNTGVQNCTGDFLIHVDSDDYIALNAIETLVNAQKKTDADIVTANAEVLRPFYKEVRHLPKYVTSDELTCALLSRKIPVNIWGRLIRRRLYIDNDISVERNVNMSEDWNVIPRLAYYAKKISFVDEVLFFYDCRNESSYTYKFNEDKFDQMWVSADVLKDFFRNKNVKYLNALKYGMMKSLSIALFELAKNNGKKSYFVKLKEMQRTMENNYMSNFDLLTKVAMNLNSFAFLKAYLRICVVAKRTLKRLRVGKR